MLPAPVEAIPPALEQIRAARARFGDRIPETPAWLWRGRISLRDPESLVDGAVPVVLRDRVFLRVAQSLERRLEPLVIGREPADSAGGERGEGPLDEGAVVALHVEALGAEVGKRGWIENAERPSARPEAVQELVDARAHQLSRELVQRQ